MLCREIWNTWRTGGQRRSTQLATWKHDETWTCFIMFPCACVVYWVYCHNLSHFHHFPQFSTIFHHFPHFLWEVAWSLQMFADTLQEGRLQNSLAASGRELKNWISDFKEVKTKHVKHPASRHFWTDSIQMAMDQYLYIIFRGMNIQITLVALVLCPCTAGRPVCPGSFGVWLSRRMTESYEYLPSQDHSKFSWRTKAERLERMTKTKIET